jgi:Phosphotransferase enzyme family
MPAAPASWSDVSPAWMTAVLEPHFPGVSVAQVRLGPVREGTNRVVRVGLEYRRGQGPERVVVKREGPLAHRLALLVLGAVEAEARLLGCGAPLPLEHPAAYGAAVDRRRMAATVVMEDVTLRGGRPNAPTDALSPAQVRDGLAGLAGLHAAYWAHRPEALRFLRPWRLGAAWAPVSHASLGWALHHLRRMGGSAMVPSRTTATELERGFRAWAVTARLGPQTVLHGDPHPGNTYSLGADATGFYDWQLVRLGNWVHDVGYFLAGSLRVEDRRAHERPLLEGYVAALEAAGAPAPDPVAAWASYRRTPVFGLATWLHTLSGGRFQSREACLATIERFGAAYADHGPRS